MWSNMRKTNEASVRLVHNERDCILAVEERGVKMASSKLDSNSFGLIHLPERVEAIGGALEIDSSPDGPRVTLALPRGFEHSASTGNLAAGRFAGVR
jgi:signal transduction histidine kinase